MKKNRLTALVACVLIAVAQSAVWAQEDNLRMRFDFTDVSGSSTTDAVSGITAKAVSPSKIIEMGDYHVLSLGTGSGYLNLTADAGALLASLGNYSISVYYRVNESASLSGNGFFLWSFASQATCTATAGAYTAYRLNAQRVASATAGYDTEKGYEVGQASVQGRWVHVAYVQSGTAGRLYIDGKLVGTASAMPKNGTLFQSVTPGSCWIGRSPFSGDNYLRNTLVYDFRLYDKALTLAEVLNLSTETVALDNAYVHGTPGSTTSLQTSIKNAQTLLAEPEGLLADGVSELQRLIVLAQTVAEGNYSQAYIDQVRTRLNSLITAVKAAKNVTLPSLEKLQQAYDQDRGFIHPGGLHTQADFDRVKQLLADKNTAVTQAYNVLKTAAYSQSSVATNPVETIVRGGTGENYINAARGATMAYQNALRWKIDGTKANAQAAVRILMAWANTTKVVTGTSDAILAMGLYGYQFAQAAELMRDYEGWSQEDFRKFKHWMMTVWYPGAVTFLRYRNGTWENSGKWWQAPGHYWSNWGLCCALCVTSIGILCDDVYVYNQGMSFFKYDQVGTYTNPPTLYDVTGHDYTGKAIQNVGLTEYLGNLVVTDVESELETGAYGRLGQMNESGRDTGHSAMALGLAVDMAKVGWNQGDDLFSYMDHRLASGIEYVAAQTQSVENLPWTPYLYGSNGYYYTDYRAWLMEGPALGAQNRPYWGTVIGIYEGVKGVRMPFSEKSYTQMGIDGGGQGGTSGGYDHMGYSVLMNTRVPQLAPADQVPTELTPKMEYSGTALTSLVPSPSVETKLGNLSGKVILHNELGGLVNKYNQIGGSVPTGDTLRLMPQLPADEEDTGLWQWNTGEQTRDITVPTDKSFIYRVSYTNRHGIQSQLCFPIACEDDGTPVDLVPTITSKDASVSADSVEVLYGQTLILEAQPAMGGGTWRWATGETTQSLTTAPITGSQTYTAFYCHTSGVTSAQTFRTAVHYAEPYIVMGSSRTSATSVTCTAGTTLRLGLRVPDLVDGRTIRWSTGDTGNQLLLSAVQQSAEITASFLLEGEEHTVTFSITVRPGSAVASPEADASPVVRIQRLQPDGRPVPAHYRGATIVRSIHADGTVSTHKEVER
ncbi:MAG: alginate lyase family protein [Bacteroidaceae bacterium]|nr:alginate lyase family protein [Bacteroidaceae bacterium]